MHPILRPISIPPFIVVMIFSSWLNAQQESPDDVLVQSDSSGNAIISERETVDAVDDSSLAEAVERRPDLNFSNVTIDGEKATVSLDDIGAEVISSVEVLRAVTPDLDADSRGGSLSLESNPTYNLEQPVMKSSFELEFQESGNKLNKDLNLTYGNAFGRFGFNITGSFSDTEYYGEFMRNNWEKLDDHGDSPFVRRDTLIRSWQGTNEQLSVSLKTDYKLSEVLSVFFRFNFEKTDNSEYVPTVIYRYDEGEYSQVSDTSAYSTNARIDRNLLDYDSEDTERYFQVGGIAKWESTRFDFQVSYEDDRYIEPNWFVIEFEQPNVDLFYDASELEFPEITMPATSGVDAVNFEFDELLDEVWKSDQTDFISTLNLKHEFEWKGFRSFLKTGLKYRAREKQQSSDSKFYTRFDGDFRLDDIVGDDCPSLTMADAYELAPIADPDKAREFFEEHNDAFDYSVRRSHEKSDPGTYTVHENISAAYVMLNIEKGRMRGIVGARVERTDLDYVANEVVIAEDGQYVNTVVRTGKSSYETFFPSVHLRYFFGEKTTLIGSWTGTIERPWYGSIVPYRHINYEDKYIDEGNPDLKPTLYSNLDLSLDYKLREGSVISVEFFHNDIEDIVFWEEVDVVGGMFDGFDLGRNNNGPSGTQNGANLIWNQQLSEWTDELDGFSFNLKITYTDTETEYPNRPGEFLPIAGKGKHHYQCSLTYDRGKTYVQLIWKRSADTLQGVDDNAWRDRYSKGRDSMELNSSYQLTETTRVFLNVSNLLSEAYESFRGTPSRPSQYNLNQRSFNFGVKMKW